MVALTDVLAAADGPRAAVVVVHGAAGQGKTALVDWAAATALDQGFQVLRVTGLEFEWGLTFGGLTAVLHPLRGLLSELAGPQAQGLRGALGLEQAEARPLDVNSGTLSLLALAAEAAPVLVVVDDAQWVDTSSLGALTFAAHRSAADRVAFVFAQREGVPCLVDDARFPRIDLGGIDEQATIDLLAAQDVVPAVASRCWHLTQGNPLALIEGIRGLSPAQRRGEAPLPAVLPVDDRLLERFRRELADLPAATRRTLGVAAVAADGDIAVITAALADLGGSPADLAPAENQGMVTLSEGRLRWRHPLLRCAVHDAVDATDRRAMHAALATATEATGDEHRVVWHLAESVVGPDDAIAERLAVLGAAAYRGGALAAAAEAHEQAARLAGSATERQRHLLDAADVRWADGDFERAATLLRPVVDRCEDPVLQAAMAVILGQTETWMSGALRSAELLERHARAVVDVAPGLSAVLWLHAAMSRMMRLDMDGALASADTAVSTAEASDDITAQFGAHAVRNLTAFFAGGGPATEVAIEPIGQLAVGSLDDKDDQGVAVIVSLCAYAQLARGEAGAAIDLLTQVIDSSDASGMLPRSVLARMVKAEALWRRGRWAESLALVTHLQSLYDTSARAQITMCASAILSRIEAGFGHEDQCRHHADAVVARASALGIDHFAAFALSGLGLLDLGAGRYRAAADTFDEVVAIAAHVREPGFLWWHGDAIESFQRAGRRDDARALLAQLDDRAATTGRLWARSVADRCRALLGDTDDPDALLTDALDGFRTLDAPFEEARTLLARGEHRLSSGRSGEGALDAATARTTFARLGARVWADRASAARGEVGRQDAALASRLTRAELRVALAVGDGLSNRDAAERLYVSPKTIDYHLQNIYRKLGLRSRTQLATLVVAEGGVAAHQPVP
jgi:DNA-binding CsgD family transcriptional regulator